MMRLVSVILLSAAGILFFLQIHNRLILQAKHGAARTVISIVSLFFCLTIPITYGFFTDSSNLLMISLIIAVLACIPEVYCRLQRITLLVDIPPIELVWTHTCRAVDRISESLILRHYCIFLPHTGISGIRIVHLSDFHADTKSDQSTYQEMTAAVNAIQPDIIFLTGDFTDKVSALSTLLPCLGSMKSRLGMFAVLGNHDFWSNPSEIRRQLMEIGVIFPSSDGITLNTGLSTPITLFGIDYPNIKPWKMGAVDRQTNHISIVLSHTPDNFFRLARSGVDIVFAGHLHGGQWRLPIIGSVVSPSIHDRLFDRGHFQLKGSHLFVSSGIGNVWIPSRINCPAEILLVSLSSNPNPYSPEKQINDVFPDLTRLPAEIRISREHVAGSFD